MAMRHATAKPKTQKKTPTLNSQKSSLIKLLILKKCSFASSFVSLLMGTYPAAAARRTGRERGALDKVRKVAPSLADLVFAPKKIHFCV